MFNCYNRKINYLRISVTDRCNLRCRYCMPEEGVSQVSHNEILTFDEIVEFTKYAVSRGIEKIKITGGEPLVRKGITRLIGMLSQIDGIRDIGLTTNGVLLPHYAKELKDNGLMRVNISLDTVDPEKYRYITRLGELSEVMRGIDAALAAGLTPVKINCVIHQSPNEPDAQSVKQFADKIGVEVRFIPMMDLKGGIFGIVHGGDGGNCSICNRLRLTSTGDCKPCLFNNLSYNIRKLGIEEAFNKAILNKPQSGHFNNTNQFFNIGG